MVKPVQLLLRAICVLAVLTTAVVAHAHKKVVVIPMAGDEIEILPKPFAPLTKNSPLDSDYTINADTVIDNITGLEWQRSTDNIRRIWGDAWSYCSDLDLDGKTQWRLPSVVELQSIVDYAAFSPSINAVAFPNTNASLHWTASDYGSGWTAWAVQFKRGNLITIRISMGYVYDVRCVRWQQ